MRQCWVCGAEIILCNGFVGGDIAALMEGKVPSIPVRETCWKCVLRHDYAKEHGLPMPFLLPSEVPAT